MNTLRSAQITLYRITEENADRVRGVAPLSKPLLFRLGFDTLGLNRIETV